MSDLPRNLEGFDPQTLILSGLDIYNWGPFGGRHHVDIDPGGTAIIGPTGSGKTTLVDALVTLIVDRPKYNLASTGGHESDRDLMSYIRGVSGAGYESGDTRHVARQEKTVTGLSATFTNSGQVVQLGALLWIDSSSFANADRKDLWIVAEREEPALDDWLTIHRDGGARALKQMARDTSRLHIFDTKKAYLTHVRRLFEVSENAFTLLNRAAGLKQLNSIDEIFRELVLDDHAAFGRATEVASEFDNLAAIHAELEIARRQQQSLKPIETASRLHASTSADADQRRRSLELLPRWFALAGKRLWQTVLDNIDRETSELEDQIHATQQKFDARQAHVDTCHERYLEQGGGRIEQTREQISDQQALLAMRRRDANEYNRVVTTLGLDTTVTRSIFAANRQAAAEKAVELTAALEHQQDAVYGISAIRKQHQDTVSTIETELAATRARPDSNIPGNYHDFRAELASALGTATDALPFIAELIEVKSEDVVWRGAVERAIGAHRLRIVVPSSQLKAGLEWVNSRNNRLHVRLLDGKSSERPATFLDDGFARKLNFKSHALREAMKSLLARIDRHCVDASDDLRGRPHSMTVQGSMSGPSGQFEKRDQQPLTRGWVTGFSNSDRLASLTQALAEERTALISVEAQFRDARQQEDALRQNLQLAESVGTIEFDSIDVPEAEARLTRLEERLHMLADPDSDAGKARHRYDTACQQRDETREQITRLQQSRGAIQERRRHAQGRVDQAIGRLGPRELTEAEIALAASTLPDLTNVEAERLDQLERDTRARAEYEVTRLQNKVSELSQRLVRLMGEARKVDTGALSEVGSDLVDLPAYLEQLRVLDEEALPEKLGRFQLYLNQSSDQGVTQLLTHVDNEVSIIEERISELNQTLRKVDYQEDRYVQLVPKRVVHESLQTLQRARSRLRSAALTEDQGESHYRALEHLITLLRDASDNRRTLGARALLDPRYRLQFSYSVLDRRNDELIESRTGSQGGSGGEKEVIASYILTASLSYALCPVGASRPLFGTVILDEAFSKSSQAVAGRIISALKEFGLHAVFVTPNKEMRLLRDHTQSAILVHRKDMQATLTSISWEELETHAEQRLQRANEVA